MICFRFHIFVWLFCYWGLTLSTPAYAKKVTIKWAVISSAVKYELKVSGGENYSKTEILDSQTQSWKADLPPGFYSYQIRAVDKFDRGGRWSDPKAVVVKADPPSLSEPSSGKSITFYGKSQDVHLSWKEVKGIKKYLVEIKKGKEIIFKKTVSDTNIDVPGLSGESYQWTVRSVLENKSRALASGMTSEQPGKPSEAYLFTLDKKDLLTPEILFPKGTILAASSGKVDFEWKKVEGAESYEVELQDKSKAKDSTRGPRKFRVKKNSFEVKLPSEGKYDLSVRALASIDSQNVPQAISPQSTTEFEIAPDHDSAQGRGYVALSSMLAPYTYKVVPSNGPDGATDASSITLRLSGEYWFASRWSVAPAIEGAFFNIGNNTINRMGAEIMVKYLILITSGSTGWFFLPKAGVEVREYFQIQQNSSQTIASRTLGATVGFDLRKNFSSKFSLGVKFAYNIPVVLIGGPSGSTLAPEASYRNTSFGIQGLYWLGAKWAAGAGAFFENRSVSYLRSGSGYSDKIYTDAVYFFGSIIFAFGGR